MNRKFSLKWEAWKRKPGNLSLAQAARRAISPCSSDGGCVTVGFRGAGQETPAQGYAGLVGRAMGTATA